jgi:hypothetical protein
VGVRLLCKARSGFSCALSFAVLPVLFLLLSDLTACKTGDDRGSSLTDSTSVSRSSSRTADSNIKESNAPPGDELHLPSVPEVGENRSDSTAKKLPEEDPMDARSPVQLKYIASSETSIRGVRLYVVSLEHDATMTVVHAFVQNMWGSTTRLHPQAIAVRLSAAQLAGAKLLDDQTGASHLAAPKLGAATMAITQSANWTLAPADRQTILLSFPPVNEKSRTFTLIIPGFVTVTSIPLDQ